MAHLNHVATGNLNPAVSLTQWIVMSFHVKHFLHIYLYLSLGVCVYKYMLPKQVNLI